MDFAALYAIYNARRSYISEHEETFENHDQYMRKVIALKKCSDFYRKSLERLFERYNELGFILGLTEELPPMPDDLEEMDDLLRW